MTTFATFTPSHIRMLARLDAGEAEAFGVVASKVHTADMGVIMSLMKLGLVEGRRLRDSETPVPADAGGAADPGP